MIRFFALLILTSLALVSCASHPKPVNGPYQPASRPEKIEFCNDRLDVYPDQVRNDLNAYTNLPVVWAGIILSTDAHDRDIGDQVIADTILEHHYFDWVQDVKHGKLRLALSPRGEGFFRTKWSMKKTTLDATFKNGEKFAKKGKLAIVYGVPESVAPDGTITLKYRYLRILDMDHFNTNQFDYGRMGEPFSVIKSPCRNPLASPKHD
jgi:hypothetical protein